MTKMDTKKAAALRALDEIEDDARRGVFGKKLPKDKRGRLVFQLVFGKPDDDKDE